MSKTGKLYRCTECGYTTSHWLGRCPNCSSWNTIEEVMVEKEPKRSQIKVASSKPLTLTEIRATSIERITTDYGETDRLLGGGVVPGSVLLIGGEPGIGKSTLMIQLSESFSKKGLKVLYNCAEESVYQVGLRASRLNIEGKNLMIISESSLDSAISLYEEMKPDIFIIDSIQAVRDESLEAQPGTVSQIKLCTSRIIDIAKRDNSVVFITGHVTKEGMLAGPKTLEHMVDGVFYFEGERDGMIRLLRSVKNRYGDTNEVAFMEMTSEGLKEINNPSLFFIREGLGTTPGATIGVVMEGTRPILVEVQALVTRSVYTMPKRVVQGIDFNRFSFIIAVLEKLIQLTLFNKDIFLNIPGGFNIKDPAIDLPVALAIISSTIEIPLSSEIFSFGEIGLTGEIRQVMWYEKRIETALRLGYSEGIAPLQRVTHSKVKGVRTLREVYELIKNARSGVRSI
ncbi:MAG TPA: DNA repair protein RadA [bacterium]|jgi:DNA repair protein RadA/Sms|nr:DNA repair protein RadA [Dictyoglomota bacterium]HOK29107.1 DNA repair protein RadA [bacterium]HOL54319.1 DNA repair protein RadA [bacterium]HOP55425.1 DNA repair protein RadA [bacterium]HPO81645.1 DNA repair protein RadA [bacterium]